MISDEVFVLSKRYSHHSQSSGFDRLADYLDCSKIERVTLGPFARFVKKTVHRYWQKDPDLIEFFYQYPDFVTEQRALLYSWTKKTTICHVFYGDEQLDLLIKKRCLLRGKLIATFHLPFCRSAYRFKAHHELMAKGIDHFVAVSSDLANDLGELFGHSRVSLIPHGVDTIRFNDSPTRDRSTSNLKLLVVGWHMRDLEMVHHLVDYSYYHRLNIDFEYVGTSDSFMLFAGCQNIALSSEISEQDLIKKYQSADALLLPLTDSTANNSILESLACGTPVITTNVGGVLDYMNSTAGWILPKGDFEALLKLVKYLSKNKNKCISKRIAARQLSLQFDWKNVARQYNDLYHCVKT